MATLPQWKRLPSLHPNIFDPRWGLEYDFSPGSTSKSITKANGTKWPTVQRQMVVPKQSIEDKVTSNVLKPYLLAAAAATGLLLALVVLVYVMTRRRRKKKTDEEQSSQSILVFPSTNGDSQPQFVTKEIHFSLPPLRSNSLGDLECQQDNPYDSDVDSDALLVPGQPHSHRSNSFSK
ncbi:uncharacterized protein LOC125503432 [Dendroctonus ponderosae]|uniref:uncharacterized protein LOC125503432 n=1 Tax=Dendroctonus ponderosae TaxID=77166 RepID=UPI0020350CA3|nr:uncharacterized protein LOC125503432 [Dendroctonus ponderosae]